MAESSDLLEDYVARALEMQEQGTEISYESLCHDHPELIDTVRDILTRRGQVKLWAEDDAGDVGDPLPGRILEQRYHVGECIGAGAMGSVYRATDLQLEREVAVKIMHPRPGDSSEAEARFLREARALATLRHRHVVPVYDRGVTSDAMHFLVMELIPGVPLSRVLAEVEERVEQGGWGAVRDTAWLDELLGESPRGAESYVHCCVRWAAELASGLAAAHAAGIIHRDVKPSNVFITHDGHAQLLDFGVAARVTDAGLTADGSTIGTPVYMAPEQVESAAEPDAQLDVYSLSATLYHMLAGRAPYGGTASAVLTAIQCQDPEPIGRVHKGLPRDLQAIVEWGMARDPGRRYGTAAALQADLLSFLDDKPVRARRASPVARAWRTARRSTAARVVAIIVVAALAAVTVRAWLQERERARHQEHAPIYADFPPTLTLGKGGRVIEDEDERRAQFARLDRAVELRPEHQATRCLRAALRFDHGDFAGAAEDHAVLAGMLGTPYSRELALRYARAEGEGSPDALDLSDLPALTGDDAFVAAFHALRAHEFKRAAEILGEGSKDLAEREYRLYALFGWGATTGNAELVIGLRDPALELAGAYGRPTTRTLYVLERALLQARLYEDALAVLEDLTARAPRDYNAVLDLATAYWRTDALDAAERAARQAITLRPPGLDYKAQIALATALTLQGRFADALVTVAEIPEGWRRFETRAFVNFRRGLELYEVDRTAAREAAEAAEDDYAAAASIEKSIRATVALNVEVCRAIVDQDADRLCCALAKLLLREPDNALHLRTLAANLPKEPSAKLAALLAKLFVALADSRQKSH